MAAYTIDATNVGRPYDNDEARYMAAEMRALKTYIAQKLINVGAVVSPYVDSGRNLLVNGDCRVQQRGRSGQTFNISNSAWTYGDVDMFKAKATGTITSGNLTADNTLAASTTTGSAVKVNNLTMTTATLELGQTLESKNALLLNAQQATISMKLWHDLGTSVSFTVSIYSLDTLDTSPAAGGGMTLIASFDTTVSTSIWTKLQATIPAGFNVTNGLFISVKNTSALSCTAKNIKTSDWQLEIGNVASQYSARKYEIELENCKRYCKVFGFAAADYPTAIGFMQNAAAFQGSAAGGIPFIRDIPITQIKVGAAGTFTPQVGTAVTSHPTITTQHAGLFVVCGISGATANTPNSISLVNTATGTILSVDNF